MVGYLIFKLYNRSNVEAASLESNQLDAPNATICTPDGIEQFLDTYKGDDEAIQATYDLCTQQFLANNTVSAEVKRTVDEWIGLDLGNADPNEVFLAYQLAIVSPKPNKTSDLFERDCQQMFESFEAYRDTVEPLTYFFGAESDEYEEEPLDTMLSVDSKKLEQQDRQLINFVQYTQLCKSLLQGDDDDDYEYDFD